MSDQIFSCTDDFRHLTTLWAQEQSARLTQLEILVRRPKHE